MLVHGGYHGAWCWRLVADRLRSAGHAVYTPTLTGLGERSHLIGCNPSMETFIEDVAQVLRFEELEDVILVGHSFAGPIISGVADRMPQRLRHLVFLDAQVLQSGQAPADRIPPELVETYRQRAAASPSGLTIAPSAPEYFGVTDPELGAWLATKLTPHPLRTYFDRLELHNPLGNGVPATYIACSKPLFPANARARELARELGWKYQELPTSHAAMLLMPDELAGMLAAVA